MLSTFSTLECKSARVCVREWVISHDVEKVNDRESVDKDVTRQGICSLKCSRSVLMFLIL